MKIALGCDHGGYDLKQEVVRWLEEHGHEVQDFGCFGKESCDYPQFGRAAAEAVAAGNCARGIVICTTGIGISIVANKVKGIRCALCADTVSARLTREHNDANMLAMGAGGLDVAVAMGGGAYYITMPKMFKVNLTGKLRPYVTAKDVSLEILRILSVKGGVGAHY